eukprot:TRINITY_DN8628_c0_g1_i1.p1 TRINITY_DN8628_c0_g1~~TRINITY_DN8628_c0_g1_i1.p1  ORF type:complete len:140 (-),score=20.64 TRINITY_DN8628_c0_g1_i1:16-435(-)
MIARLVKPFQALVSGTNIRNTGSTARDILAMERTYLAWIRTSFVILGIGVGLSEYRNSHPKVQKNRDMSTVEEYSPHFLVAIGQVIILTSSYRYFRGTNVLLKGDFIPSKMSIIVLSLCAGISSILAHQMLVSGSDDNE